MHEEPRTEPMLRAENTELRARLEGAKETLSAIRNAEVDALVIESAAGPRVYTLHGVDAASNGFRGESAQVSDAIIAIDGHQRVTSMRPPNGNTVWARPGRSGNSCRRCTKPDGQSSRCEHKSAASALAARGVPFIVLSVTRRSNCRVLFLQHCSCGSRVDRISSFTR